MPREFAVEVLLLKRDVVLLAIVAGIGEETIGARSRFSIPIRRRVAVHHASPFQPGFPTPRQACDSVVHAPRKNAPENVFRVFQRPFTKLTTAPMRSASHRSYALHQRFRTSRQRVLPLPFTEAAGT